MSDTVSVGDIVREQQAVAKLPLVGAEAMSLIINPYRAKTVLRAIQIGEYTNRGKHESIARVFREDDRGLGEEVTARFFQFNRHARHSEIITWANGRRLMMIKHLLGVRISHPAGFYEKALVEVGSIQEEKVLAYCCNGNGCNLELRPVVWGIGTDSLVGFID